MRLNRTDFLPADRACWVREIVTKHRLLNLDKKVSASGIILQSATMQSQDSAVKGLSRARCLE